MKVVTQLEQSISFSKIFATQSVDIILESKCGLRNRKTLHIIILRLKLAGRKVSYVNSDILFWAALSFLVLFAYPTPEVPTPSFEYHAAFSVVTLGIVSGIQQTYHQFHHENVARLFTPQLKLAAFAGRMLVGIPTILLVKFCIKALAKWSLPIVANTLGIPIKSTSYIPVLSQEIPITTSNSGETLVEVKQPGYPQKLFFSWLSSIDVDTGIRFLQYAALAWSVVALVPSLLLNFVCLYLISKGNIL